MNYSLLLEGHLAEQKHSYHCLRERHVQALWFEQLHLFPLHTDDGKRIEVLSPGIWNTGPGPDFLKAHVRIGKEDLRGDVELHLTEGDWFHHGHHLDPRYCQVVLHLSFWLPKINRAIHDLKGQAIPSLAMEPFLKIPADRIPTVIDLEAYPYKRFVGAGRCAEDLFEKLPREKTQELFHGAATWRLQEKARFLREQAPGLEILMGMARALGYKENANGFGHLALELWQRRHLAPDVLQALAFGLSGFLSTTHCRKWGGIPEFQRILKLWLSEQHRVNQRTEVQVIRTRPNNHPLRRLAYLLHLIQDPDAPNWPSRLQETWREHYENPKQLHKHLLSLVPRYTDSFWEHHYTFGAPTKGPIQLTGDEFRQLVLVNTFLPLIYEQLLKKNALNELKAFDAFFMILKGQRNSKSRYLTHRFFGDSEKRKELSNAASEQGAYQIHHDFCMKYEASCEGCPFVQQVTESGW